MLTTRLSPVIILASMLGGADPAPAQTIRPVAPGDHVRFRTLNGQTDISGTVVAITHDSVRLKRSSPKLSWAYGRANVTGFQRRLSAHSGAGRGALTGFALGAGLGTFAGVSACESACDGNDATGAFVALGILFYGGIGTLTGAFIGSQAAPNQWTIGVWPQAHGLGLGLSLRL